MIVRGTAQWASVFDVNEMSGKYQVDICNLDKDTVKDLEKRGLTVKKGQDNKKEYGSYITAKSSKYAPKVLDNMAQPMDGSVLIGNGSKIKASINPYSWTFKGKSGISAALNKMMVLKLVAYAGNGNDDVLEPEELEDDNILESEGGSDEEL
jgi:hypothetical protein|tara:strand:+ start:904 stop:1359 length:456 start_codon:yes stop_codon:yes gene_type:complete